jgi:RecG-like helicase
MPTKKINLKDLKNVGKATLSDLAILGINSVDDLAHQDPTQLFEELERQTGKRHDPCVWDVFAAIIHEAQTGESTPWWTWTPHRKVLQKTGKFRHVINC